jgi:hypothetical protein
MLVTRRKLTAPLYRTPTTVVCASAQTNRKTDMCCCQAARELGRPPDCHGAPRLILREHLRPSAGCLVGMPRGRQAAGWARRSTGCGRRCGNHPDVGPLRNIVLRWRPAALPQDFHHLAAEAARGFCHGGFLSVDALEHHGEGLTPLDRRVFQGPRALDPRWLAIPGPHRRSRTWSARFRAGRPLRDGCETMDRHDMKTS